jgi:hypothetical protein
MKNEKLAFQNLVLKVLCEKSNSEDLHSYSLAGGEAEGCWRSNSLEELLNMGLSGALLVIASEVLDRQYYVGKWDVRLARKTAFELLMVRLSKNDCFQLGAISFFVDHERDDFYKRAYDDPDLWEHMIEDFNQETTAFAQIVASGSNFGSKNQQRFLRLLWEREPEMAEKVAQKLRTLPASAELRNLIDKINAATPKLEHDSPKTLNEYSLSFFQSLGKAGLILDNGKLNAQKASERIHSLLGDTPAAHACDLALYRDQRRPDRKEILGKLVGAYPDLMFLLERDERHQKLVKFYRKIFHVTGKPWVLFGNGTCVTLEESEGDLGAKAQNILREHGRVKLGSASADFQVDKVGSTEGWLVTCQHGNVLTYLLPGDVKPEEQNDLVIEYICRIRRDLDALELDVIHVENKALSTKMGIVLILGIAIFLYGIAFIVSFLFSLLLG